MTPVFGPDSQQVAIPSALPVQAVLAAYSNAHSGADRWSDPEDVQQPPSFVYDKPAGTTVLQIRPQDQDVPDRVVDERVVRLLWRQVRALSDLDGDVFLATLAQAMAAPADEKGNVWITGGQILDYRGIQPIMKRDYPGGPLRRAGHRHEDLAKIADCVQRMTNTWITVRQALDEHVVSGKRTRKKRRLLTLESRLIQVGEVIRQRDLMDIFEDPPPAPPSTTPGNPSASSAPSSLETAEGHGRDDSVTSGRASRQLAQALPSPLPPESITIAWRYQMGTWLTPFLAAPNQHIAWLVQQALRYDPYRELFEKRLARYLIFNLRIPAVNGNAVMTTTVGALIDELSLPISEDHPDRSKQRFEQALETLRRDRQIDTWRYLPDNPPLPARRWASTWLTEWRIEFRVASVAALPTATVRPVGAVETPTDSAVDGETAGDANAGTAAIDRSTALQLLRQEGWDDLVPPRDEH
ncbi:MAG TPA: hypothetical protein VMV29_02120 [Ktedonobacterales bacterium]|nr:hypothetical protein [Ktedonobacterales bacterium]